MPTRRGAAALCATVLGFASAASPVAADEGPALSGAAETRIEAAIQADYPGGSGLELGAEEYANLRLKAALGERGSLYAAFNLMAAAGSAVPGAGGFAAPPFVAGPGYAYALELERLYCRVSGDAFDLDAGLQRLAFGYGLAWGPMDFLSKRNPLFPNARPRGSLAIASAFYPGDDFKLRAFAATGGDALDASMDGAVAGISAELHGSRASAQALYAIKADTSGFASASHLLGLSVKLDAGAGFVLDALYELDGDWLSSGDYYDRDWMALRGLSASIGADWSLAEGDIYLAAEYLYRGGSALEPGDNLDRLYGGSSAWSEAAPEDRLALLDPDLPLGELNRRNYLYGAATWRIDDYTSTTLSCVACLDDASFAPSLSLAHEPFQGLSLSLDLRVPLDERALSGSGGYGELGPRHSGTAAGLSARARFKF